MDQWTQRGPCNSEPTCCQLPSAPLRYQWCCCAQGVCDALWPGITLLSWGWFIIWHGVNLAPHCLEQTLYVHNSQVTQCTYNALTVSHLNSSNDACLPHVRSCRSHEFMSSMSGTPGKNAAAPTAITMAKRPNLRPNTMKSTQKHAKELLNAPWPQWMWSVSQIGAWQCTTMISSWLGTCSHAAECDPRSKLKTYEAMESWSFDFAHCGQ